MTAIKLLKLDELANGTIRLQSQLCVGKDVADFILVNGVLKHYGRHTDVFGFYETDIPYEIVDSVEDMQYQQL